MVYMGTTSLNSSIGGGVALCVKKHLIYIERPDLSIFENDIEFIFMEINKECLHSEINVMLVFYIVHLEMISGHSMINWNLHCKK